MIESSLNEVDRGVIEAAQSMGAGNMTIIMRVLLVEARTSILVGVTIALGTILGYSAMAGIVGGGGLGGIINQGIRVQDLELILSGTGVLMVIAVLLGSWLFAWDPLLGKYFAGLFCLLGHMFPCMFKFKGGKGHPLRGHHRFDD